MDRSLPQPTAEGEEWVMPDNNGDGYPLITRSGSLGVVPEMPTAVQAGAKASIPHDLQSVIAGVSHARIGILRNDDTVGDVTAAILSKMIKDRQRRKVDVRSSINHVKDWTRL